MKNWWWKSNLTILIKLNINIDFCIVSFPGTMQFWEVVCPWGWFCFTLFHRLWYQQGTIYQPVVVSLNEISNEIVNWVTLMLKLTTFILNDQVYHLSFQILNPLFCFLFFDKGNFSFILLTNLPKLFFIFFFLYFLIVLLNKEFYWWKFLCVLIVHLLLLLLRLFIRW